MCEEFDFIYCNKTWQLVDLPQGNKTIFSKWAYKLKPTIDGSTYRYNIGLVAHMFEQKKGVDFHKSFALVVKWGTIHCDVAFAAHQGWKMFHLNVTTIFLNGPLINEMYMTQLEGHIIPRKEYQMHKIMEALYGLHKAPRAWNGKIDTYIQK
jgi:hypothetical protein